ncbi:hypothetical protein P2R12_02150 [Cytobacillus oceanisediminis]|uniref:hypothetical protein n=1 Tax=Cytobacillus oceanisediminis TaxID=665099 RepID=UPI0023DBBF38|nr:hypothetical protein [Cytobacillus oceanisediminis]MDF2035785.1 hypothetical protein [Cytobacillus oceanisediminis]
MNDAYNRIYRFHGRNDFDNLSIVEQDNRPVPFHLSQMDQDITKTPDSVINTDGTNKEQFSAPAARSRKSKSKPLILPPPAIEARQVFRTSKNHKTANKKNIIKESEEKKIRESKIEENKNSSEKQRIQNLRASYLLTPYSPMLTWSPSLPSKNTSVRTQFFLSNKSAEILEQSKGFDNNITPSLEITTDQKIDSSIKDMHGQISHDDETPITLMRNSALQDEFSILLDDPASKTDEKYAGSNNDETLQKAGSQEFSESKDIPFGEEKNVNNGSVKPFQLIENGLKLDAFTLQEDFIHLLQSEGDDDSPEILKRFKDEGKPSDGSLLYNDNEYSIDSEFLQNDSLPNEKDALSLDEKYLLMLTESSSDENQFEESKLKQDEAFALLSEFYLEQEESSSEENVHSSTVFPDKNEESSSSRVNELSVNTSELFENNQEETSSYSEDQTVEECTLEKKVSMYDNESSSEDFILYKGEFSKMLENAYAILEVLQTEVKQIESSHETQPSTIQEIFSHLIDEAFESYDKTDDEPDYSEGSLNKVSELLRSFSLMLNDATEPENLINEGSSSLDENRCLAIESSSHSIELCYSDAESDSYDSSCSLPLDESLSIEESCSSDESSLNFEHHCDESEESSSTQEESSSHEESPNLQDEFELELLVEEELNQEPSFEHKQECFPKIPLPTVKIPVLVGKLDIDIDVFDIFPLHFPIKQITKLEWSIGSLDTHVVLPSNTLFIKGTLLADIEYVNPGEETLHSFKIPIKFDKTSEICWLFPPDMPQAKTQKEFMFKSDGCDVLNSHFESSQSFTEKIKSQLRCINFVWHNDLTGTEKPGLQVQGRAILEIDLLQEQYIEIKF